MLAVVCATSCHVVSGASADRWGDATLGFSFLSVIQSSRLLCGMCLMILFTQKYEKSKIQIVHKQARNTSSRKPIVPQNPMHLKHLSRCPRIQVLFRRDNAKAPAVLQAKTLLHLRSHAALTQFWRVRGAV